MELFAVDDDGRLFISPAIDDWDALARHEIDTVIDLEGASTPASPPHPTAASTSTFPSTTTTSSCRT
jgi:hypothetical protein